MTKMITKDPAELRLHPLHKHLPGPIVDSPEWHSFVDGISGAGADAIPPIIISPLGQVIDGGRRWRAAKQLGWKEIRCVEQPSEFAAVLMVESLFGQRDMSRGAKVYIALGLLSEFVDAAEQRRAANLRRGVKTLENPLKVPKDSNCPSETIEAFCARLGISPSTYKQAKRVRDMFDKDDDLRAELEPALLSGEKNLWNIISGVAGADPDNQKNTAPAKALHQLELFANGVATHFSKCNSTQRQHVFEQVEKVIEAWPDELIEGLAEILERRLKEATR